MVGATADAAGGWNDGATALLVISGTSAACPLQLAQLGDSQVVLCSAFGADALCPQHRVGNDDRTCGSRWRAGAWRRAASSGARAHRGMFSGVSPVVSGERLECLWSVSEVYPYILYPIRAGAAPAS